MKAFVGGEGSDRAEAAGARGTEKMCDDARKIQKNNIYIYVEGRRKIKKCKCDNEQRLCLTHNGKNATPNVAPRRSSGCLPVEGVNQPNLN